MRKPATPSTQRLEIPADDRRLSEVRDFVTRACEDLGYTGRALANIRLAVDEACTNVVKHAYPDRSGTLRIQVGRRRGSLEIRVADQGKPFDGRVEIPHLGQWVDARRKGGFGVFLMHRLMDEVRYETTPAGNEWILRKRLPRPPSDLGRRLRRRYAMRGAAAIVLTTVAVAAPLAVHEGRKLSRDEERTLLTRAEALAEASRPALLEHVELSREQTRLFEAVHAFAAAEARVLSVTVVDRQGVIWASERASATFTPFIVPDGLGAANAAGVRRTLERIDGVPVLHLAVPVHVGSGTGDLGAVHLSCRWTGTEAAIRAAYLRVAAVALAVDGLALLLVLTFLAHLLGPIQRLVDGVRALGQGGPEVAVDGPEEIGAIASAFNEIHSRYRAAEQNAADHARLQEEMQLAREIQSSILPRSVPEIPGFEIARVYRPAQEVGGDYYDFLDAGPGLTGVVVADVAGKGVPGSIVMSMVRTALRMETRSNAHAGDVLARLHAFVSPDLRHGMFVTMFYLVLDSRNRVVSYASAGHTPMLLYRSRSEEVLALAPHGIPVGLAGSDARTFERALDVERLRLHEGDLLLLYTDGITEARNAAGEEYGEERLTQAMRRWGRESAENFVAHLESELVEFTGGAGLQDDLTLVAIKERQGAPSVAGEVQQKLFDLVEKQGVPAAEACARLHVSPATYYRLKHSTVMSEPRAQRVVAAAGVAPSEPPAPEAPPQPRIDGTIERPESAPGCVIVRLGGALDTAACKDFERLLADATATARRVVVDLSGVAYVSSRGWGLLAATRAALRPHGDLVLSGLNSGMRDVHRMLGFEPIVAAFSDAASALAALESGGAVPPADAEREPAPASAAVPPAAEPAPLPAASPSPTLELPSDLDADWESLRVRTGHAGAAREVTLVELAGILDTVSAAKLGRTFDRMVAAGARRVLVDLSRLEFVSSAGWGCFTSPLAKLRADGGDLRLFGMGPGVARIYDLLHLRQVLQSFDVLVDALASFGVNLEVGPEPDRAGAPENGAPESGGLDPQGSPAAPAVELPDHKRGDALPGIDGGSGKLLQAERFVARIEPFGRGRRTRWLRLEGPPPPDIAPGLQSLLEPHCSAVLFVDTRALEAAPSDLWRALERHAARAIPEGGSLYLVCPNPETAPPVTSALSVHRSAASALRAHQGKRPPKLGFQRLPDIDYGRDGALRREGWEAYLAFLEEAFREDAA